MKVSSIEFAVKITVMLNKLRKPWKDVFRFRDENYGMLFEIFSVTAIMLVSKFL